VFVLVNRPLCRQLLQQRLRLLEIARVEPLREPGVNRSKQFARLLHLALVAPQASAAHCGAKFAGLRLLLFSRVTEQRDFSRRGSPDETDGRRRYRAIITAKPSTVSAGSKPLTASR
jgi:hypothetical protein